MSLELNSDNDYVARNGAANLGNTTEGTFLGWYYKNDSTNGDIITYMGKSGSTAHFRTISATQIRGRLGVGGGADANLSNGEWAGLAITVTSAGVFSLYMFVGGVLTLVHSEASSNTNEITGIELGQSGGSYTSARGARRYQRFWTRVLTTEEMTAEFQMTPDAETPAASETELFLSWPLPDGTDTTDLSGNGNVPTISGAVTSAEEPTIGGGGASPAIVSVRQSPARPLGLGSFGVKVI